MPPRMLFHATKNSICRLLFILMILVESYLWCLYAVEAPSFISAYQLDTYFFFYYNLIGIIISWLYRGIIYFPARLKNAFAEMAHGSSGPGVTALASALASLYLMQAYFPASFHEVWLFYIDWLMIFLDFLVAWCFFFYHSDLFSIGICLRYRLWLPAATWPL
jgi:hypothetical protein